MKSGSLKLNPKLTFEVSNAFLSLSNAQMSFKPAFFFRLPSSHLFRDSRASKDDNETTNTSCSTADPSTSGAQKKFQNPNFSLPIISLISVSSKQRSPFTFSSPETVSC
ncbi:hypothetical protein L1987_27948 [Smallanthus sonchifolius]|uniref:Uncharacterized protein n=1 Tax=Smallanthus sonchifolius TaxID=185202 RepID=A0ACB9IDC8_9ASTR|nr:hypothetical protein L1987_27948 [Smallanthus sonchifolius]